MATYQEQLDRLRKQRGAKEKVEEERKANALSHEQIKNWRNALALTPIGIAAYYLPDEMIQALRDKFNQELNAGADAARKLK